MKSQCLKKVVAGSLMALIMLTAGCKTTDGMIVLDSGGKHRSVSPDEVEELSGGPSPYLLQVGDQVGLSFRIRVYREGDTPWDYRIEVADSMEVRLSAAAGDDREDYKIDVGDLIGISFLDNWPLNASKTVRPDGYITMPEVGDVKAAGKTTNELQAELMERYRKTGIIQGDPRVTVNVDFSNPDRLENVSRDVVVRPDGAIRLPGLKNDILIAGLTVAEAAEKIKQETRGVLRNEPEVTLVLFPVINTSLQSMTGVMTVRPDGKVSVQRLGEFQAAGFSVDELKKGLETRCQELAFNDVEVSVDVASATGSRFYVGGEVGVSGVYPLAGGNPTALQAIMMAYGPNNDARLNNVLVIRRNPEGKPLVFKINLHTAMTKGYTENDIALRPFDVVYVPKKLISRADLFVEQYIDELVPFDNSLGVSGTYYLNTQKVKSSSANKNLNMGASVIAPTSTSTLQSLTP